MKRELEVSLIEWPEGRDAGGPRLLGGTRDPAIVALVKAEITAQLTKRLDGIPIEDDDSGRLEDGEKLH